MIKVDIDFTQKEPTHEERMKALCDVRQISAERGRDLLFVYLRKVLCHHCSNLAAIHIIFSIDVGEISRIDLCDACAEKYLDGIRGSDHLDVVVIDERKATE